VVDVVLRRLDNTVARLACGLGGVLVRRGGGRGGLSVLSSMGRRTGGVGGHCVGEGWMLSND
jgi:hypothetical protein